ncbi:hypothetical protein D9M69_716180 [compost metagenome]
MADARFRPGGRHHPRSAVELRDIEGDVRLAVGIHPNDAGEEGDQFLGRRITLQRHAAAIATGADPPHGSEGTIDQPAVEIADLEA